MKIVKATASYTTLLLEPAKSLRNNHAYVIAKTVSTLYQATTSLIRYDKATKRINVKSPYRIGYRIILTAKEIKFIMRVPTDKAQEFIRKLEGVFENHVTVTEIPQEYTICEDTAVCCELSYKKHAIFSLDTSRTNNYPLPSLLATVRTLEGDDVALFDVLLEPYKFTTWAKDAATAYNMLNSGNIPNNAAAGKIFRSILQVINSIRWGLGDIFAVTKEQKAALRKHKLEDPAYLEAQRVKANISTTTKRKQQSNVLKAWLRIVACSKDPARAKTAAITLASAWADIAQDNELIRRDIPTKWNDKYIKAVEQHKGVTFVSRPILVSEEEAGKFMQLPGADLIREFPQIVAKKLKDTKLPDELTQDDIPHVRIGTIAAGGKSLLACIPLVAYKGVTKREVYDALCTASFAQGKQGSGKSDGYGITWAYDMILNGYTAIVIDTADGQVLRNLVNSLPEDYPEDKIHALNFDDKEYPIAANWSDLLGRINGNDELQAIEISERLTARFISFINALSNTGEFSDRMKQYIESCMRAITKLKSWSFLDLELALTSSAFRDELLQLEDVQQMQDVVFDLKTLQEKSAEGKIGAIVEPILSRIKLLSNTQFMANLFYQEPKIHKDGKPVLDFRKLMDNKEGGYGHLIVIQASYDAWQDNQATILSFLLDKINFCAFSRIDQEQDERRPVLVWIDEPHKIIKGIEAKLAGTSVEFRKYRVKNLFTAHSIEQMGAAMHGLLDGGAQITSYKTERLTELQRFAHSFVPYDDAAELYDALPEKWVAVNSVRLPSGKTCPAFIADMTPPPKAVKDRSCIWKASAKRYGRNWKEVREYIQKKRQHYSELDAEIKKNREEEKQTKNKRKASK